MLCVFRLTHCLSMLAISWLSSFTWNQISRSNSHPFILFELSHAALLNIHDELTCMKSFSRSSCGEPRLLCSASIASRLVSSDDSVSWRRTISCLTCEWASSCRKCSHYCWHIFEFWFSSLSLHPTLWLQKLLCCRSGRIKWIYSSHIKQLMAGCV